MIKSHSFIADVSYCVYCDVIGMGHFNMIRHYTDIAELSSALTDCLSEQERLDKSTVVEAVIDAMENTGLEENVSDLSIEQFTSAIDEAVARAMLGVEK